MSVPSSLGDVALLGFLSLAIFVSLGLLLEVLGGLKR